MNTWQLVHEYRRRFPERFKCYKDDRAYATLIDDGDEPLFWCPSCNLKITPGLAWWERVAKELEEGDEGDRR